eukprot:TRINITY_DN41567_c0_g1_i1.p1 TRINITY_DN41567_c0_g1~~TRINITY_DN41567_c0_g1_i1.p1  ORF type:complete len:325 (+),score=53.93 TRINITY_DN41567_c0_g1_i1:69-1043(+)
MSWRRFQMSAVGGSAVFIGVACLHHQHKRPMFVSQVPARMEQKLESKEMSRMRARKLGYIDEIPRQLVVAMQNGSCVAMVGAGLSYPAGLPGFEGLLRRVAALKGIPLKMQAKGSYDDLDNVQFELADQIGKEAMVTSMRSMLYLPQPFPRAMQDVLVAFRRLPFAAIVSWNWDNLLDDVYDLVPNDTSGLQQIASSTADLSSYTNAVIPLVKMQGNLDDPATVVLTRRDYEQRHSKATQFLEEVHKTRTVLYVGMSLRPGGVGDERRAGSLHYAIMNDVTAERKRDLLENYNIHAISFDSKATSWQGSQMIMEELALLVYGAT